MKIFKVNRVRTKSLILFKLFFLGEWNLFMDSDFRMSVTPFFKWNLILNDAPGCENAFSVSDFLVMLSVHG